MKLTTRELTIFAMLGAVMYASKMIMEFAPNIHLLGVFIVATTVVYRWKALYPIYTYVLLEGFLHGFATWWLPYLYVWTVLWGMTMLLPKKMLNWLRPGVYMCISALHGFAFGLLYAPVQAWVFGLSFEGVKAWVIAGLPFDITHGISNFFCGILIVPVISVLKFAGNYTEKN